MALPAVQAPAWHVSLIVQRLPSLQDVPFDFGVQFVALPQADMTHIDSKGSSNPVRTLDFQLCNR